MVRREDVEPELIESITVVLCQLDDFQGLRDILDAKDVARFLSELHKIFHAAIHRNNAYSIQVNGDRVLIYPGACKVALALLTGGCLFLGVYLL